MRPWKLLFAGLAMAILVANSGLAAEFLAGHEVTISADETWEDDVYISANRVNIEGTVKGDVVVGAQYVHVTGEIEGSLCSGAQQTLIEGKIGRTVRAVGQAIEVGKGAQLGGDLVAAGFSLEVKPDAVIAGDLVYAGFQAMLRGQIEEDVWGAVNRSELFGKVGRELSMTVDSSEGNVSGPFPTFGPGVPLISLPTVQPGLTIHDGAEIGSKLIYHAPVEANISADAKVSGPIEWIESKQAELAGPEKTTAYFWRQVKRYLTFLAMGVLMVVVCPTTTTAVIDQILRRPVISFVTGIVAVPLSLVISVLILGLIVAIPLTLGWLNLDALAVSGSLIAAFTSVLYLGSLAFFLVFGAATVTCIALGRVVFTELRIVSRGPMVLTLAFGLFFYVVLTCVPYLWVGVSVAAVLFGFGGMFLWLMGKLLSVGEKKVTRGSVESG